MSHIIYEVYIGELEIALGVFKYLQHRVQLFSQKPMCMIHSKFKFEPFHQMKEKIEHIISLMYIDMSL